MNLIEEIIRGEGEVLIETTGTGGQHTASTWSSFIEPIREDQFLIAGWYSQTEKNILEGSKVRVKFIAKKKKDNKSIHKPQMERRVLKEVLLTGYGSFTYDETDLEKLRHRFSWAKTALKVKVEKVLKIKID